MLSPSKRTDFAVMVGQPHRLPDPQFKTEAMTIARELCAEIRAKVEILVSELKAAGYVFAFPDCAHVTNVGDLSEWNEAADHLGIHLPVFLQAWIVEVGSVNLMGSHPAWPKSAYSGIGTNGNDVWYTDALVLEVGLEHLRGEFEDWRLNAKEYGATEVGPFHLETSREDQSNVARVRRYNAKAIHVERNSHRSGKKHVRTSALRSLRRLLEADPPAAGTDRIPHAPEGTGVGQALRWPP